MYNKARPPGRKLPFWHLQTYKKTTHVLRMVSCHPKKSDPHPDLLSLLIALEVVLPSFCPGGSWWGQHGGPMGPEVAGPKFSGELGGWNFSLWKWPIFWRPSKNNSCIYPTKKKTHPLSNGFVQKNMVIPETQKKKRLTIVPRSRKTPWSEVAPQYWEKGKHNICKP